MEKNAAECMDELFLDLLDLQIELDDPEGIEEVYQGLVRQGIPQPIVKLKMAEVLAGQLYNRESQVWKGSLESQVYLRELRLLLGETKEENSPVREKTLDENWRMIHRLVEEGNQYFGEENDRDAVVRWLRAWQIIKQISLETGHRDMEYFTELLEETEDFPEWLEGVEMGLEACDERETRLVFCREVLEFLNLEEELRTEMKVALAASFYNLGEGETCIRLYKDWLSKEPENEGLIHGWCRILEERGELEQAAELLETRVKKGE